MRNLKRLLLPVPPMIEEAFGYTGSSRFVAFYGKPIPLSFYWQDPVQTQSSPHWAVWLAFVQHRRVHPFLDSFNLGIQDRAAKHWLLLDRIERQFSIGLVGHIKAFLGTVPNETLSSDCEEFDIGDSKVIQAALCALVVDWLDEEGI